VEEHPVQRLIPARLDSFKCQGSTISLSLASWSLETLKAETESKTRTKSKVKIKMNKSQKFSIGTSNITVAFLYVLRYTTVRIITL